MFSFWSSPFPLGVRSGSSLLTHIFGNQNNLANAIRKRRKLFRSGGSGFGWIVRFGTNCRTHSFYSASSWWVEGRKALSPEHEHNDR